MCWYETRDKISSLRATLLFLNVNSELYISLFYKKMTPRMNMKEKIDLECKDTRSWKTELGQLFSQCPACSQSRSTFSFIGYKFSTLENPSIKYKENACILGENKQNNNMEILNRERN